MEVKKRINTKTITNQMTATKQPQLSQNYNNANDSITPGGIISSNNSFTTRFLQKNSKLRAIYFFSLFLISGVCNTLLVQLIYNNISFNPKSMLTNICIFLGYALLKLFDDGKEDSKLNNSTTASSVNNNINKDKKEDSTTISLSPSINNNNNNNNTTTTTTIIKKQHSGHLGYIFLAIFDCLASLLTTVGQIAVGSGLFQVLFSSKIIFAAILSKIWLKSHVSKKKWISIFIIFFGLCITVKPKTSIATVMNDSNNSNNNNSLTNTLISTNSVLYFGTFCVLLASFIFSASHIYAEDIIRKYNVGPYTFGSKYGIYSVIVCLIYIFTVTFYNRLEWIELPISRASDSDLNLVIILFLILMVTSVVRSSSMYTVLAEHGTVSMGVLYSLQSIIVFGTSAIFLCDPTHPIKQNQCITTPKLLGSTIVIFGILLYNSSNITKNNLHKS